MDTDISMSSTGHMELLGEQIHYTFLQLDSLATVHEVDFPLLLGHTNVIFRLNMTVTDHCFPEDY